MLEHHDTWHHDKSQIAAAQSVALLSIHPVEQGRLLAVHDHVLASRWRGGRRWWWWCRDSLHVRCCEEHRRLLVVASVEALFEAEQTEQLPSWTLSGGFKGGVSATWNGAAAARAAGSTSQGVSCLIQAGACWDPSVHQPLVQLSMLVNMGVL